MTAPASATSSSLRSTFLILTAAAAGMGVLLAFLPAGGHDQLWCLYAARHVLDGTSLYGPALLESNPPLIIWLSMIPTGLAAATHLPAAALGKALVIGLQVFIAWLSLRQMRRLLPSLSGAQIAALLFTFVALFNVVPARDLGQRDYLLALLCLPYLLAAARRAAGLIDSGVLEPAAIGLLAGVGLALKPHEAVLPLAVELFLIVRSRSLRPLLRPEPFALLAVAGVYFFAIKKITPAYLTDVLPLLRDTYWAVGSLSLPALVGEAIQLHMLGIVAFLVWRRRRDANPARDTGLQRLVPMFLTAGCASTVAYYLQGTGWYYQQLPAITFFAAALAFQLLPFCRRSAPRWLPKSAVALSILALCLTTHFMNYPFTEERSFAIATPDPGFFAEMPAGTSVATLTTTVDYSVMPAARYHLTIAQRYPHLWMLPAILRNESPGAGAPPRHVITAARLEELDALQHRFMTEDLARWKPSLVLIERCHKAAVHCQLIEDRDDDLLAWFLRDPGFAAEWKNYSYAGHHLHFDAYIRNGDPLVIH